MIIFQDVLSPPPVPPRGAIATMAADCLAAFDQTGRVEEADLRRAGWSERAIEAHKHAALDTFVSQLEARETARA